MHEHTLDVSHILRRRQKLGRAGSAGNLLHLVAVSRDAVISLQRLLHPLSHLVPLSNARESAHLAVGGLLL